jgi:hypothetical protein
MARRLVPAILLSTGLLACSAGLAGPAMPAPLAPADGDAIAAWLDSLRVPVATEMRVHWRFQDPHGEASGPGSLVFVPPDSLRFDVRGPLGSGARAAMVVGDEAIWAEPAEDVADLVPNYTLLWAMIGQVRAPEPGDHIEVVDAAPLFGWRYTRGADTIDYIIDRSRPHQLVADVRRAGERIGRVHTVFDTLGRVARSRLDVPSRPARLDLTFTRHRWPDSLPRTLWDRPDDEP